MKTYNVEVGETYEPGSVTTLRFATMALAEEYVRLYTERRPTDCRNTWSLGEHHFISIVAAEMPKLIQSLNNIKKLNYNPYGL